MRYQEAYRKAMEVFAEHQIADAANDAFLLMEHVTGLDRTRYFMECRNEMPKEQEEAYFAYVEQRKKHIPLQHITGKQEFMGYEFLVNEQVLIPRQDTEILVELADQVIKEKTDEVPSVLDLCTGSGCIAISLKLRNPKTVVVASDVSKPALEMARKNAKRLQAEVDFRRGDMFESVQETYDVIVSNPPYIPTEVIQSLAEEVRIHDPYQALDGKEDGLFFYRILADQSSMYLKEGGHLMMEIGCEQGDAVKNLLAKAGFHKISVQKDLAGLDRVVIGVYNR